MSVLFRKMKDRSNNSQFAQNLLENGESFRKIENILLDVEFSTREREREDLCTNTTEKIYTLKEIVNDKQPNDKLT